MDCEDKVYQVILETHNLDVRVDLYWDKELAIEEARLIAEEFAGYYSFDVVEEGLEGCLYHAYWGNEGDNVVVKESCVK